ISELIARRARELGEHEHADNIEKALAKGREEGKAEGEAKGEAKGVIIASKMGMSPQDIKVNFGMTVAEAKEILAKS
ncbi:MAG: hypothetical protein FWG63_06180, partial [Defluviitaleaceae bacterium]|nr:hypothetical protein [Defluviitaleaceae bacterium]